ncbi:MAG TPA: hypothetical protein VGO68_11375 [Pyrinomonadaceae bacterium]|nr:hypothetical protein [Pyrinomonadaceae bacterium]
MTYSKASQFAVTVFLLFAFCAAVMAQQDPAPKPSPNDTARAEAILNRAIEALGGSAYLNVKTVIGRGFYTGFHDGVSQNPARFVDYISYPDNERTEFIGDGIKVVQTNSGETGWLYDGATKSLSDMKAKQIDDFKRGMRTSVENLLRGWWKKENATLSYVGRREAGVGRRNETVRLTYPNGFWIEYEFAAKEGLPAKVIYKTTRKKEESDEDEEVTEEDRLAKHIAISQITAPWAIDHFINGVQASRVVYESVEYNSVLNDSLFVKPTNIKSLK